MAKTGAVINVKKPQFVSPGQMGNIVDKFIEGVTTSNPLRPRRELRLRQPGRGYARLRRDEESLQQLAGHFRRHPRAAVPRPVLAASGGRRAQVSELACAGMAVGIAGLFIEAHPDPDHAKCDGPSALPLDKLEPFLKQMKAIDDLVKSFDELDTSK